MHRCFRRQLLSFPNFYWNIIIMQEDRKVYFHSILRTIVKIQMIIFANVSKHQSKYGGMYKTLFYNCQQWVPSVLMLYNHFLHVHIILFWLLLLFYADMGFFMLPTNNKVSDRRSLTKNRNGLSIFTVFWKKFAESTPISTPEIVMRVIR